MFDALQIIRLHDQATLRWHQGHPWPDDLIIPGAEEPQAAVTLEEARIAATHPPPLADLLEIALAHHRANYDLWHEEDKAREPEASDARIAAVKHAIDALNQTRNDLVESMDQMLLAAAGAQHPSAPLHSETPGLILDRLSILALKLYHTAEESCRATASDAHRQKNLHRLAQLKEQRSDLAACLDALWREVLEGRRRFKLYRQLKMYNDPELNPAVYSHKMEANKTQAGDTG